jgi:hypothetical protein
MSSVLAEAWLAQQVERAVAPYVGRLPAREIAWMREQLLETLATDDYAAAVARGAMPREVEESGEVVRGTSSPPEAKPNRKARG